MSNYYVFHNKHHLDLIVDIFFFEVHFLINVPEPLSENNSNKMECFGRASIIPTALTPLLIASKQVFIFGIMPPVIVSFLIISKISEEDISSINFFIFI